MSSYPDSVVDIESVCGRAGYEFETLQSVRERVYRGTLTEKTLDGSTEVYLKLHPESRSPEIEEFASVASAAGHPACQVIKADTYCCLLMAPASGRSLSQLLPVVFLPGVWRYRRQQYIQAFHQIGHQLGRLHSETERGTGPVLSDEEEEKALRAVDVIRDTLEKETVQAIEAIFTTSSDVKTSYAITYGDRTPHNIFFDGDQVTQIDSSCKVRSVAYEHRGVVLGVQLMAKRLPYATPSKGAVLKEAYWDGYAEKRPTERENTAYHIRHLYGALKLLETYEHPKTIESKLTRWVDRSLLYQEIERTAAKLAPS